MIDYPTFVEAFLHLQRMGPRNGRLKPDNLNVAPYGIDNDAAKAFVDQSCEARFAEHDVAHHGRRWWFKYGVATGLIIGITAARIEMAQAERLASDAWRRFDILGGS